MYDSEIEVKIGRYLKYLDIWFDGRLSFREHFRKVADKANRKLGILNALMMNLRRPRGVVRQMLLSRYSYMERQSGPNATKVAH